MYILKPLRRQKWEYLIWPAKNSLFKEETPSEGELGLSIPWMRETIGGQHGPAGPVSLEVCFILTLQVHGIDLTRIRAYRKFLRGNASGGNTTGEKLICSAAKVYGVRDELLKPPQGFNDPNYKDLPPHPTPGRFLTHTASVANDGHYNTEDVHTTIFNGEVKNISPDKTGSVGVYYGIDLFAGLGGYFPDYIKNKVPRLGFLVR
ncbi:hypothetical protein ABW20_dc0101327 [Dactylellina cionopaga]|nr:hypothetical protein ABW20_dc0101327 [Dactylellina cionopaga]